MNGGMDVYGELLTQIRVSKDENGSKYAIKRLAELVKEGDVARLFDACPTQTELLKLWDLGVTKNAAPHYVENFCVIFRFLLNVDGRGVGERLLHPKRVRIIHSLLSSGNRTKISSGLLLLKHIAMGGSFNVSCIMKNIDFSLNAIKVVGVPPKVAGGTMMNAARVGADGEYAYRLWTSGELAKMPTRAAYVEFFKAMMENCSSMKQAELLTIKNFLSNAVNYLSKDPYHVQEDILTVIKRYVLDQDKYALTPPTKGIVLSDKFLSQLAQIIQQASERLEGGQEERVENVLSLASQMLIRLLSDPNNGVVSSDESFISTNVEHAQGRKVTSLLGFLKPTVCKEHLQVINAVFSKNAFIASLYLAKTSMDLDPKKMTSCLINLSIVIMAFDALLSDMQSMNSVRWLSLDVVLSNWKNISPGDGLSKSSISKCLQHPVSLVSHTTVMYLTRLLQTLLAILDYAQSCCEPKEYATFRESITKYSKSRLPDVQTVIALHSKIDHSSSSACRSQKLSGVLGLLSLWITAFPDVLLESNIQIDSILPSDVLQIHRINQREYIHVIRQAASTPRSMTLSPVVGTIAKLCLQETDSSGEFRSNFEWLVKQMQSTNLFYDFPMSGPLWVSNAIEQKSEFVIDFFMDSMRTTMKKPIVYLSCIHSCDFSTVENGNASSASITPLLACALEKMCRIMKSKTRDILDKIKVTEFMHRVLVDYCSQSMQPLHVIILFKSMMDIEFASHLEEEKLSKRKRQERHVLENRILEMCNVQELVPFNWMLDFQEKALDGIYLEKAQKKKKKKQQHEGLTHTSSSQDSLLGYILYDERIVRLQKGYVQFWTSSSGPQADRMLAVLEEHPEYAIWAMQYQFLFGKIENIISRIETFISALRQYTSRSTENAQAAFDALSGSSIFWKGINERLNAHVELAIGLYQIIKLFENSSIIGQDDLFTRIYEKPLEYRARDLQEHMHLNRVIILAQVMCQSSSDIYTMHPEELTMLIQSLISSKWHRTIIGEVNVGDIIGNLVLLNAKHITTDEQLNLLNFIGPQLSDAIKHHSELESYIHIVKIYCRLHSMLQGRSTGTSTVMKSLVGVLFSNVSYSGVPSHLVALIHYIDANDIADWLINTLNMAKSENSKYRRRLMLASLAPVLDACLSKMLEEPDFIDGIRTAFLGPLLQFYTSKRIDCVTKSEDVEIFKEMHRHSLAILPSLFSIASLDSVVEITKPLLQMKPHKNGEILTEYHNPSMHQKVWLLTEISRCTRGIMQENPGNERCCIFVCNLSIFAMKCFSSIIVKGRQDENLFDAVVNLLDVLGDAVAEFNQDNRGTEPFLQMFQTWASDFIPCTLKIQDSSLKSTRCLRRFTASLVPEDVESKMLNSSISHCSSVFEVVCPLFLKIVTADATLEVLREANDFEDFQNGYLTNALPLDSIVACVGKGAMVWNGLSTEKDTKALRKTEICEILETFLDIIAQFESVVSNELINRYNQILDTAESALLRYLLASYNASLSGSDMAAWSLIKALNNRIWRRKSAHVGMESPQDDEKDSVSALLHGPVAEMKFAWGKAVLSSEEEWNFQFNPLRCAMTVIDYPEWRHLLTEDRLPDNTAQDEISAEYFMSYEPSGYDPAFIIPACLSLLRSGNVTAEDLIDSAALSVIIRCLGSGDTLLRAIAFECLSLLDQEAPPIFEESSREVERLRLILNWLKTSMTSPFQRLSSVHAVFASEMSVVIFRPASDLYPLFSKYLSGSAFLDGAKIPLLKAGLSSSDRIRKTWFQKLLLCGIRNGGDVFLYSKAHIFELEMSIASSKHNDHQFLAIMLIQKATSIPKAARVMAESCGLMTWLATAILAAKDAKSDGMELSRLKDAWKLMSFWKGPLQRGSERDRVIAARELKAAEMRLTNSNQF